MTTKAIRRCGCCGRWSRNKTGEYKRQDGTCGYINQEEGEPKPVCTDCRDKQAAGVAE